MQTDLRFVTSLAEKGKELNSNLAESYNNRASAYLKQGNLSQAISDFNKAIQINPQCGDAYINRGLVYYARQDYDKAKDDFQNAEELGCYVDPKLIKMLDSE